MKFLSFKYSKKSKYRDMKYFGILPSLSHICELGEIKFTLLLKFFLYFFEAVISFNSIGLFAKKLAINIKFFSTPPPSKEGMKNKIFFFIFVYLFVIM